MRVFYESGDRRGNSYSLDFDHMHAELEKWRTAEQIAPGHSGANCSPHQSYPSGSGSKSSARLAGSQPTIRYEFEETGSESAQNHPSLLTNRRPCRQAPWKMVSVSDDEVQQMQAHLEAIAEAYPRSDFGPANRTTARDMLAAAKLADPQANADHVRAFLASKFQHKAPYPYEAGIRIFGGMLRMVAEDFGAWFRFQQAREAPMAAQCAEQSPEHSLVLQHEGYSSVKPTAVPPLSPMRPPTRRTAVAAGGPGSCQHCSGKGYRLDDTGTEQIAGKEFRTVAASACDCSKGREIGYRRLAAIERKVAEQRGVGWIPAHRHFEYVADAVTGARNGIARKG